MKSARSAISLFDNLLQDNFADVMNGAFASAVLVICTAEEFLDCVSSFSPHKNAALLRSPHRIPTGEQALPLSWYFCGGSDEVPELSAMCFHQ